MRIVGISDTHGQFIDTIPDGDVLVHCGDCTGYGKLEELAYVAEWLRAQKPRYKVLISGNHDWCFERPDDAPKAREICRRNGIYYLQDSSVKIDGKTFYGSPWTPKFFNWAFMIHRGQLFLVWNKIPAGIDVLITHGPPVGKLDWSHHTKESIGCHELREAVERVKPKLHLFGHIHASYGITENADTIFANCSTCDESYAPINAPMVVDI